MVEVNFKFDLQQYVSAEDAQKVIDTFPSGNGIFAKYVHSILNDGHTIIFAFTLEDVSVVGKNHAQALIRDHIFKVLAEVPMQIKEGPETSGSIIKDTLGGIGKDLTKGLGEGAGNLLSGLKDLQKTILIIAIFGVVLIGGIIAYKVSK